MQTKGIILAGGSGTRLYPATSIMSKQLQLVYDKPMIYYPLSTLMQVGITEIMIITTGEDLPNFRKLLRDGNQIGLNIVFAVQDSPKGIAEAFLIAEEFIGNDQVCLILGDNIFYGNLDFIRRGIENNSGGYIFGYEVTNPQDFGVLNFDKVGAITSIEEKPTVVQSPYAIPGIYIFDSSVVSAAKGLKPSYRGELEITDLHKYYLQQGLLKHEILDRGIAWLDTGTPASLLEAGMFIQSIEKRQGRKIACLEEIAIKMGYISKNDYLEHISALPNCSYKDYCLSVYKEF